MEAIALWQDDAGNFKVQSFGHAELNEAKIWLESRVAFCSHSRRTQQRP